VPRISVVIPTRNRWHVLRSGALRAALRQEDVDHEVIVVDDGSTDETTREVEALDDPRLRVVRREQGGGMSGARNTGIEAASADWVAFLDDDDLWSPRKLTTQLAVAESKSADFVYAAAIAVDEYGDVLYSLYLPPADELTAKLRHACVIPAGASNVIVRTALVRSLGGFDERFVHVGDWDLWIRLADAGKAAVCEDVLVAYVLHPDNMHALDDPSKELDALVRKHAAASPPRHLSVDRLGYARWVAGQRSRAGRHGEAAGLYLRSALAQRSPGNLVRAADALVGKRLSSVVRRGRRDAEAQRPPDWLVAAQR
jgi:glycosyltransferase involved in cell wall biosynthesis